MAGIKEKEDMISLSKHKSLLKNRQFFSLWVSQLASEIAYHIVTFSLIVLIFDLTGETLYVSLLVVLVSAAPILFSTVAGIFADNFDRRRVMLIAHAIRFLLGIVMLFIFPFPLLLLPIAFLLASVAQFFEPAQISSIPSIVKEDELFVANSYFSFTRYTMFLIGYTIAGPLLQNTSPSTIFLIVIGLYVIALGSVWTLAPLKDHLNLMTRVVGSRLKHDIKKFPKRLKEGFQFMITDKVVGFLAVQVASIFAIEKGVVSLAPAFALEWLGLSIEDISFYLILPTGIGTLVGTLVANTVKTKIARNRMVTFGTLLDGVVLIGLAGVGPLAGIFAGDHESAIVTARIVAGLAFFSGFADPFIIIPAQTVLQERTPKEKRGRVFGNFVLLMNLFGLVPVLAIGVATKFVSIVSIVATLGVIVLILGLLGLIYWRKYKLEAELQPGA